MDAPRQNWELYRERSRDVDRQWLRGLSLSERFVMYADLFDTVWNGRTDDSDREHLDIWAWNRKLADRRKFIDAFSKLDELQRDRRRYD